MPFFDQSYRIVDGKQGSKNNHVEWFPILSSAVSSASHLCTEENLGLCYKSEQFQSISHPLRVTILI